MIVNADALVMPLADQSVQMIVTSPPYWGLRDYGLATWVGGDTACDHKEKRWDGPKQTQGAQSGHASTTDRLNRATCQCGAVRQSAGIGLEPTLDEYLEHMRAFGRECWRVLRPDGTLWLNLGDCYNGSGGAGGDYNKGGLKDGQPKFPGKRMPDLKPKDLVGLPWRVAFALQADGWYLRSDIIWHKPNPMPESVTDRPTKAHEYVFLMAKQPKYYYDAEAVKEPTAWDESWSSSNTHTAVGQGGRHGKTSIFNKRWTTTGTRNRRSVWTVPTKPYRGAHFATFPPKLVEPCVLAGSPAGGVVLDPFCGSGTVGEVCRLHGRRFVGLDLSMKYLRELALPRAERKQAAGTNGPLFDTTPAA